MIDLPKYKSHKVVMASKILSVSMWIAGDCSVNPHELRLEHGSVMVSNEWCERHKPSVGGYFVVYEDGYSSFSPAKAFEGGYTRIGETSKPSVEQLIQNKGLTASRVTPQDIESNIKHEGYFTAAEAMRLSDFYNPDAENNEEELGYQPLELLTFCVIVLKNGFTVTGESACASPENFDEEIGRKIARENAINKIWPLMGYALKQKLHEQEA